VAGLEELIRTGELVPATKKLSEFRKRWGPAGKEDTKRIAEELRKARQAQ